MNVKLKQYLDSGEYLPDFMEDFHDQKNLFKRLNKIVEHRKDPYTRDINWTSAQVYTVDIFLWYMASHGYTLQKSRKQVDFYDIERDLSTFEKESQEEKYAVLKQLFNQE